MRKFCFVMSLLFFSSLAYAQDPFEVIYLVPSDQRADESKIRVFKQIVKDVQTFFADEMERHGFGRKTFEYNPNIRIHAGKHTLSEYLSDKLSLWFELSRLTWLPEHLADIVFMEGTDTLPGNAAGMMMPLVWGGGGKQGISYGYSLVWIPVKEPQWMSPVLAHELAHVFGLSHTSVSVINGKRTVMSDIARIREIEKYAFSLDEAEILDNSVFLSALSTPTLASNDVDADVNNDGRVDLSDVLVVRRAIEGSSTYDTDVNRDGRTDELDLLIVKAKAHAAIVAAAPVYNTNES